MAFYFFSLIISAQHGHGHKCHTNFADSLGFDGGFALFLRRIVAQGGEFIHFVLCTKAELTFLSSLGSNDCCLPTMAGFSGYRAKRMPKFNLREMKSCFYFRILVFFRAPKLNSFPPRAPFCMLLLEANVKVSNER